MIVVALLHPPGKTELKNCCEDASHDHEHDEDASHEPGPSPTPTVVGGLAISLRLISGNLRHSDEPPSFIYRFSE
jgi:hypothetical protein